MDAPVPNLFKNVRFPVPCIAGIDEAGRGPVLGPLIYTLCYCPEFYIDSVKEIGVNDSKVLSIENREKLLKSLAQNEQIGWASHSLRPNTISNAMMRRNKINLNLLSHNTMVDLIRYVLSLNNQIKRIFIDTVGTPDSLEKYLGRLFPKIQFKVSKKADSIYPIVSAASIIAKVCRDHLLENWTFDEPESLIKSLSTPFGSGYPGDPETIRWLKVNCDPVFGYPRILRFSWSTSQKALDELAVKVKWSEEDENDQKVQVTHQKRPNTVPPSAFLTKYFSRTHEEMSTPFGPRTCSSSTAMCISSLTEKKNLLDHLSIAMVTL